RLLSRLCSSGTSPLADQLVDVQVVHDRARIPPGDLLRRRVGAVQVDERNAEMLAAQALEDRAHQAVDLLAVGLAEDGAHELGELRVADRLRRRMTGRLLV